MSIGPSGRVVIELDPSFKAELHAALEREGVTLKQWFLQQAQVFVASQRQPGLFQQSPSVKEGRHETV